MAAEVFNDDHVGPVVMPEDVDPSCDTGCNYVTCKEDMSYEELCTLEGMIALFKHDESLDKEIANLKEDCLNNTIIKLEAKVDGLNAAIKDKERIITTLELERNEYLQKVKDEGIPITDCSNALMLMAHVEPADIPDNVMMAMINAAMKDPSILLNYISEDVKLSWPVSKPTDDGIYEEVHHGLKVNDDEMEDA